MTDTVTVSAEDVQVVSDVLTLAAKAFGSALQYIPHYGDALEACGRMAAGAERAQLPEDPVQGIDALAIGHHEMMAAYERQGFTNEQAFMVVLSYVSANASAVALRAAHG